MQSNISKILMSEYIVLADRRCQCPHILSIFTEVGQKYRHAARKSKNNTKQSLSHPLASHAIQYCINAAR